MLQPHIVLVQLTCVRAMLWFGGHFMLVFLEEFFYISRH